MNHNPFVILTAVILVLCWAGCQSSYTPWEGMTIECKPTTVYIDIEEHGCRAEGVAIEYCEGNCRSATIYSHDAPYYKSICECCKATEMKAKIIPASCHGKRNATIIKNTATRCECNVCETKKKKKK